MGTKNKDEPNPPGLGLPEEISEKPLRRSQDGPPRGRLINAGFSLAEAFAVP